MKYKISDIPSINKPEKIFFVGIKGVGVCPLSLIAKGAGIEVAGSDIPEEFITDGSLKREGIHIYENFNENDIKSFFGTNDTAKCLVVTTGAHKGFDNPQVKWAKEHKIPVLSQGQALGLFMDGEILGHEDLRGIAVAGSHGKTTISSLLSHALVELGVDPSYTVGTGELFPIGNPGHFGKGELFIAEADEYASEPVFDRIPKFLYLKPSFAIFNNIDFDHPDLFASIDDIVEAFYELSLNVRSGGILFINGDDPYLADFKKKVDKDIRIISFGEKDSNDYVIKKIVIEGFGSKFTVAKRGSEIGVFEVRIPGFHNAKNTLAVIALLDMLGFEPPAIRASLKTFTGSKRRMEQVGNTSGGALIIDDYGHHPLEILKTIETIKKSFPDKKLVAIFQPHTYSRTKSLLNDFSDSFVGVDQLVLLPIFKSQRDTERDNLSLEEYVAAFKAKVNNVEFLTKFEDVVEYMGQNFNSHEYIILTIGAGDLYKIAYDLKS